METDSEGSQFAAPLDAAERRRGRHLAVSSHPAGMTFWMVFTEHLPTLLLVSLGASEAQIGLQRAFLPGLQLLQLPTLRTIAWLSKRRILVAGQLFALVAALPLMGLGRFLELDGESARVVALASLAFVAVGLNVGNTVWFPLLRSYVEPGRIGAFFGTLRSGWHLALVLYYAGAHFWLQRNPGSLQPLFVMAGLLGLLRIVLITRLPERSERTGEKIRVREAIEIVRGDARLRRYLVGVGANGALRTSVIPFVIVMMRREIGFSEAQIVLSTLALYAGGLASLYLWGRVTDHLGAAPIFRICSFGLAALLALLCVVDSAGTSDFALLLVFFAGFAIFTSGFGVADTQVLFQLTPPEAPARTLVIAGVITSSLMALAPILAGAALEVLLDRADHNLSVYHAFFGVAALLQVIVFVPLRSFSRSAQH